MEVTPEIEHAVSVTAATMLAESSVELPLVFHETTFKLVVKGSKATPPDQKEVLHEFPIHDKVFQLLRQ